MAQRRIVHVGKTYQVLTTLYPSEEAPGSLTTHFEEFRKHASERLDPAALLFDSEVLQNRRVSEAVVYSMALALLLSGLLLLVCLVFHFRGRFVDALMALLPVVCAVVWTFGLLHILDVRIGLYALLVFPLVIGIAMDQSVVLIQRFHDRRYASLRQVLRWGGRPNVLTVMILVIGCGCLVQVRFQALQEMAAVALVAVGVFTVATLGLVPAILQIRQEGGLRGWMAAGDD